VLAQACGKELELQVSKAVHQVYRRLLMIGNEYRGSPQILVALMQPLAARFQTEDDFRFLSSIGIFGWLHNILLGANSNSRSKKATAKTDDKGKGKEIQADDEADDNEVAKEKMPLEDDDEEIARQLQAQFDAENDFLFGYDENEQSDPSPTIGHSASKCDDAKESASAGPDFETRVFLVPPPSVGGGGTHLPGVL